MVEIEGVHTPGFLGGDFRQQLIAATPLDRIGQPDDIADVAVFLASEDARWVSGVALLVAGGNTGD